jgi:hypothetical protein
MMTATERRKRAWDTVEHKEPAEKHETVANEEKTTELLVETRKESIVAAIEAAAKLAKTVDTTATNSIPKEISLLETFGVEEKKPINKDVLAHMYKSSVIINDSRHRFALIKPAVQLGIEAQTNTSIMTKGKYIPDPVLVTQSNPQLTLEVSGNAQVDVDAAVAKIKDIMENGIQEASSSKKSFLMSTATSIIGKVFLPFEPDYARMASFNVRGKIVGPQGSYIKHIMAVSGAEVSIRGRGSGFVELGVIPNPDEGLHLHIQAYSEQEMSLAKQLAEDLLATVKKEYDAEYAKLLASISNSYQPYMYQQQAQMDPAMAAYYAQYYAQYSAQYAQYYQAMGAQANAAEKGEAKEDDKKNP